MILQPIFTSFHHVDGPYTGKSLRPSQPASTPSLSGQAARAEKLNAQPASPSSAALHLAFAGFNYVADVDGSYTANSLPTMISQTASNSVALTADYGIDAATNTVYADYSTGDSTGSTESIAGLEAQAVAAKDAGLTVILRPLIDFLPDASTATLTGGNGNIYAAGDWRAYYNPGSVQAGIAFLQNYDTTVLLPLAKAAQTVGAQILDIGTEMDEFTGPAYQAQWDSMIAGVRAVYTGQLTYSAIGDDDLSTWQYANDADANIIAPPNAGTGDLNTQVSFLNKLDYVGIDNYSALSNDDDTSLNGSDPSLQQLVNAWEQPFSDDGNGTPTDTTADQTNGASLIQYYESVAAAADKPLLFTELGYNSAPDAASQPFYTSSSSYDPALQALLYNAFFKAWQQDGNASLQGVWLWNWEPDPASVGAGSVPNWTPQDNSAALAIIKAAYQAAEAPCFLPGTHILTPQGDAPIEDLRIGDMVCTIAGAARPIRWIGTRAYGWAFARGNAALWPVRIAAGALADGVPSRDLWLSQKHALFIDGVLVEAGLLVNGGTIRIEAPGRELCYINIELDSHDILIAENTAAETFLDRDCRHMFQNAATYDALYPDACPQAAPMCFARRVEDGAMLEAMRVRLARRISPHLPASRPAAPPPHLQGSIDYAGRDRISGWAIDLANPTCARGAGSARGWPPGGALCGEPHPPRPDEDRRWQRPAQLHHCLANTAGKYPPHHHPQPPRQPADRRSPHPGTDPRFRFPQARAGSHRRLAGAAGRHRNPSERLGHGASDEGATFRGGRGSAGGVAQASASILKERSAQRVIGNSDLAPTGTSQTEKSAPRRCRCPSIFRLNTADDVSITSIFGCSATGKSAITRTRIILSGCAGGSPTAIARTTFNPSTTRPQTV